MKRTRIAPMSETRHAENIMRKAAMDYVRQRDGHMCVGIGRLPEECHGPLNGHEIITRAQGGSITDPDNIVLLCDLHNGWCDLHHDEAVKLGFRQSRTDPYSSRVALRLPHIAPRRPTAPPNADALSGSAGAGEPEEAR